jgi:large subunit ribosomal protein L25
MAAEQINLSAKSRETIGTGAVRRLRNKGKVPAVVYGSGREAKAIQLEEHSFEMLLCDHASEYLMIDLSVDDGAATKVLLKEVQHHPLTRRVMHVDFHEVQMDHKVRVSFNIHFVGTPTGVTLGGGTVDFHVRAIQVECLPGDIVESIDLDISHLDVGEHMLAGDIELDAKFRRLTADQVSIVSIAKPRVAEEDDDEGVAAVEGEEGAETKEVPDAAGPAGVE